MSMRSRFLFSLLILVVIIGTVATSCSTNADKSVEQMLKMAPLDQMPTDVKSAPVTVQQAYQFAVANPDVIQHIPCYCGCGSMGHTSNYSCYVAGAAADGTLEFDSHALGCSICVDITQDAMRLVKEGQSVVDIRAYIDRTYAQYGPSNMP